MEVHSQTCLEGGTFVQVSMSHECCCSAGMDATTMFLSLVLLGLLVGAFLYWFR